MTGWLLAQLPRAMSGNQLVQAFVGAAEHTGDSFRLQLDALEYQLDPDLAPPEMLAYLASWLGFSLDLLDESSVHRPLLHALGRIVCHRGSKAAVTELLTHLTGGPVNVTDGGGVFGPDDDVPPEDLTVHAELAQLGPIGRDRIAAIVNRELPIGASLDLQVTGGHQPGGQA